MQFINAWTLRAALLTKTCIAGEDQDDCMDEREELRKIENLPLKSWAGAD